MMKMPKGVYDRSKFKKQVTLPAVVALPTAVSTETDEEILTKLKNRFATMDKMTVAAFTGAVRALIISGPAGLGKSYGVMRTASAMIEQGLKVELIKGFCRATGLYKALYENRAPGNVIVFDDCDAVFFDKDCLNLLKGACDMSAKRSVSWRAETNMKDELGEQLPTSFDFEGTIIFITNMDFDAMIAKDTAIAPSLVAMISRSMYLDLGMKTTRDYLIRIKQVCDQGMLTGLGLDDEQSKTVLDFIEKHLNQLRELSLRMVVKIATLMLMDDDWQTTAKCVCFKPQ